MQNLLSTAARYSGQLNWGDTEDLRAVYSILGSVFTVVLAAVGIYYVINFIFYAIGLNNIAKAHGVKGAGLAFVPVVGSLVLGRTAAKLSDRKEGSSSVLGVILLIFRAIFMILTGFLIGNFYILMSNIFKIANDAIINSGASISLEAEELLINNLAGIMALVAIFTMVFLVSFVLQLICFHKIAKAVKPESATVFTILCVIFNGTNLMSFFLFALRNKVQAVPPAQQPYQQGGAASQPYNPYYSGSSQPSSAGWNAAQPNAGSSSDGWQAPSSGTAYAKPDPAQAYQQPAGQQPTYQPQQPAGQQPPYQPQQPAGPQTPYQPQQPAGQQPTYQPQQPAGQQPPYQPQQPAGPQTPYQPQQPAGSQAPFQDRKPPAPEQENASKQDSWAHPVEPPKMDENHNRPWTAPSDEEGNQ